jgi:hypothetical protein
MVLWQLPTAAGTLASVELWKGARDLQYTVVVHFQHMSVD